MSAYVCLLESTFAGVHLIKLGPGHHHVAEVVSKVRLVEYLLGQEVLVVMVQIVLCLHLSGEFTVESAVHHPPGHTLRHHERHSVLMTATNTVASQTFIIDIHFASVVRRFQKSIYFSQTASDYFQSQTLGLVLIEEAESNKQETHPQSLCAHYRKTVAHLQLYMGNW